MEVSLPAFCYNLGVLEDTMATKTSQIESRLARLERELRELKATVARDKRPPWWREIIGSFKDDRAFDEILRLGAAIRKRDRKGPR